MELHIDDIFKILQLNSKELDKLKKLKHTVFDETVSMLTLDNPILLYETICVIKEYGFDKTYNYLLECEERTTDEIMLNWFFLTDIKKNNYKADVYNLRKVEKMKSGVKCVKCKSDNTFTTTEQKRGGDESASEVTICNTCGHRSVTSG